MLFQTCWNAIPRCDDKDIAAAIMEAVSDGVDVINL